MRAVALLYTIASIGQIACLIHLDLSHAIVSSDPIFPGLTPFKFTQTFAAWKQDDANQSYFQSANTFVSAEHFGTHLDAPRHGSHDAWTVDQIPFERFVSLQALIVDVSKASSKSQNYQIRVKDLNERLLEHATGFFVLLFYTGRSKFWPDQVRYAGSHQREELEFPGLSAELASHLVTKYANRLVGVGIDTLSGEFEKMCRHGFSRVSAF